LDSDELPLWSAPFGLALLETVVLGPDLTVLDIGFGTGFPLLELAARLGPRSRAFGVDPSAEGARRAHAKAAANELGGVQVLRADAEHLPLASERFDLVVSNNGFNNVSDLRGALAETRRVCRKGAQLALTLNLPDTMRLFYDAFAAVLRELGLDSSLPGLAAHIRGRRPPLEAVRGGLEAARFAVTAETMGAFSLRFLDGRALLTHPLIRRGFREAWEAVPPAERVREVFALLERRLDEIAVLRGELRLEVPFACIDARAR
jgi:SAM-dependent methyltransferase